MEDKKALKISLSSFFLIIAIIAIVIMGLFIYKLNSDKKAEVQKSQELKSQVTNLNGTVSDLQGKINSISETINSKTANKNVDIKIGTFEADDGQTSDAESNYDDCGVTLANNNLCSVYSGFGTCHLGTYSIEGSKLVCNTLIDRGEEGGIAYGECNIIFEFEIINSQKIKLTKIRNNSSKQFSSPGLKEGMTYSFSESANIKVLVEN